MSILKVGDEYINMDQVHYFFYSVNPEDSEMPGEVLTVRYNLYYDRHWLWFRGDEARALKRWLDKNSIDVMEEEE